MMDRKRGQSPPYERGDANDEIDANVDCCNITDYNNDVSVLTDEEQNRIKSEVRMYLHTMYDFHNSTDPSRQKNFI